MCRADQAAEPAVDAGLRAIDRRAAQDQVTADLDDIGVLAAPGTEWHRAQGTLEEIDGVLSLVHDFAFPTGAPVDVAFDTTRIVS
jgi:hypothetical protein